MLRQHRRVVFDLQSHPHSRPGPDTGLGLARLDALFSFGEMRIIKRGLRGEIKNADFAVEVCRSCVFLV